MADIELNELEVKSDAIPDDWNILLINPETGAVAKNMTVAKFVELFTQKQPEATISKKGLKSHNDIMISNGSIESINPNNVDSNTIKFVTFSGSLSPTGRDVYGLLFTLVAENSRFRHQLFYNNGMEVFRRYYTAQTGTWTSWGQYSITASLSYSLEKNALTDTISLNNSILPPPPQIACQRTLFQAVILRNSRKKLQTARILQYKLKNTSGRLRKSDRLFCSYRKKINNSNKSSISLIARYSKCNLPRAGPPRLIQ